MLVVTATYQGDIHEAIRLYRWILKLSGELKAHDCLLVADPSTPFDRMIELREIAGQIFREVRLGVMPMTVTGWPDGPNAMFRFAATYISQDWPQPFLWMEPDCVPMRATWLHEIDYIYSKMPGMFMGDIYGDESDPSKFFMSGVAVYPADAASTLKLPCLA